MTITESINASQCLLMEDSHGVRLRNEYGLAFDPYIDMGGFVYDDGARGAPEISGPNTQL